VAQHVSESTSVIKVGFWYDRPQQYFGGLNYLRNLLYALSVLPERQIQPYIFFGKRVDDDVVRDFESLAIVVRTSVLDRMSPLWLLHRILYRWLGSLFVVQVLTRKYGITVLSHAEHLSGVAGSLRLISWIPDFQYLHLPELFPELDVAKETRRMMRIFAHSDVLLLSSYAALADFKSISGAADTSRVKVLHFVSQPHAGITQPDRPSRVDVATKYGIESPFFYLPNQFWVHKNHMVVFRAMRILAARGLNAVLICSGNLVDYRYDSTAYADELKQFISSSGLDPNIKILGAIPYADVLDLMKHCVAVINPSRFEGWSSTVEEARSLGTRVVLSRIPVHLEQNPPKAIYFDPDDADMLADALEQLWDSSDRAIDDELLAEQDLRHRTFAYAQGYVGIVMDLAAT